MRFALMLEPQQGLTYDDQLAIARRAEAAGFETLFRSDHYAGFPGDATGPTTDAWAVLAGLARETDRIGLGSLVSPVALRHPGNFAKLVTTVDHMSGGRIEVGVGAGWNDDDFRRFGIAFPPIGERADLLEEQFALLHGLWGEPDGWSFEGEHVRVEGAYFRPRGIDGPGRPQTPAGGPRPRIITGATGSPRSLRIAARWVDEYNVSSSTPGQVREIGHRLDDACRAIGRAPETITRSAMVGVLIGRDAAEVGERRRALLAGFGRDGGDDWFESRTSRWVLGTPDEAREAVRRYADAGAERLMLQDFLPLDLEMIDLAAEALIGRA
jgi:alkanesulfonate monooxygenase SsuD/methylene tetrahydromethanopterin reductase-like flavin-dependent oxidoreductase (luciferase family)